MQCLPKMRLRMITALTIFISFIIILYVKASLEYQNISMEHKLEYKSGGHAGLTNLTETGLDSQKKEMNFILNSISGKVNQKKIEINISSQTSRRTLVKLACPSKTDPNRPYDRPNSFYRWLFVSDKLKLVVCAIPKVASTFFKQLVTKPGENKNMQVQFTDDSRPTLEKYEMGEKRLRLRRYKKVIFVRHPLSRLWSAYTSKIVTGRQGYFEKIGKEIISRFRKSEVNDSLECEPIVTFNEFTQFLIDQWKNGEVFDAHWAPYKSLCHPCLIRYNFIGRLESYEKDMFEMNDFIKIPRSLQFAASSVNSSLNGLLEAGCRLNMAPSCGTKEDIIQSNLHYLSLEGLVSLEEDTSWIRGNLSLWLNEHGFAPVHIKCTQLFLENFSRISPYEAINLIKTRKRTVRIKAFKSLTPLEMNTLKEIYEEDYKLYGYEDL